MFKPIPYVPFSTSKQHVVHIEKLDERSQPNKIYKFLSLVKRVILLAHVLIRVTLPYKIVSNVELREKLRKEKKKEAPREILEAVLKLNIQHSINNRNMNHERFRVIFSICLVEDMDQGIFHNHSDFGFGQWGSKVLVKKLWESSRFITSFMFSSVTGALSRSINRGAERNLIKGLRVGGEEVVVSHLRYADD